MLSSLPATSKPTAGTQECDEARGKRWASWWFRMVVDSDRNKKNLPSRASCLKGSNIQCTMQQPHNILTLFTSINETQVSGTQVLLSNRKFFLKLDLVTMRVIFNDKGKVCWQSWKWCKTNASKVDSSTTSEQRQKETPRIALLH